MRNRKQEFLFVEMWKDRDRGTRRFFERARRKKPRLFTKKRMSSTVAIELIATPILIADSNGVVIDANRSAFELFARPPSRREAVVGVDVRTLIHSNSDTSSVSLSATSNLPVQLRTANNVTAAASMSIASIGDDRWLVTLTNVNTLNSSASCSTHIGVAMSHLEAVFDTCACRPVLVLTRRLAHRRCANAATLRVFGCSDRSHLIGQSIALLLPDMSFASMPPVHLCTCSRGRSPMSTARRVISPCASLANR
jgi:hypothetical protein